MRGVAHISFAGGGVFLPARDPYDLELLAEHVADRVRSVGKVHVAFADLSWSVCRSDVGTSCASCGHTLDSACYSSSDERAAYCVRCAFSDPAAED
jgi:hypothetical protein